MIVLDIDIKTGEIEAVGEVVLVDFAKVFIATGRGELELSQHVERE